MARKVRSGSRVCLDCGEDVPAGEVECPRCGEDLTARALVREDITVRPAWDDDLPMRASRIFWFDALITTEYWWVPVSITVLPITAALVLGGVIRVSLLEGLFAAGAVAAITLLLAWHTIKRREGA